MPALAELLPGAGGLAHIGGCSVDATQYDSFKLPWAVFDSDILRYVFDVMHTEKMEGPDTLSVYGLAPDANALMQEYGLQPTFFHLNTTFFPTDPSQHGAIRFLLGDREFSLTYSDMFSGDGVLDWLQQQIEDRNRRLSYTWPASAMPEGKGVSVSTLPALVCTGTEITRYDMASNLIAKLLQDGMIDGRGWFENATRLRMEFRVKPSKDAPSPFEFDACLVIGQENPPTEAYSDPGALALWMRPLKEIADRYGPLQSDIHDILQMHWIEHRDKDGWAYVTIADIMNSRCVKKWGGKYRLEDIRRHSEALRDVLRPAIEGQGSARRPRPGGRGTKEDTVRYSGPVWHYEIIDIPAMFGPGLIEGVKYRPGTWLLSAIEPFAQQLMKRTPALIRLDAKHEMHKKLGKALDYLYRVNRGKPVRISMRALLEGARVEISERDRRLVGEYIEKVEGALSYLYDLEVIGEFGPQDILKALPPRGRLEAWLKTIYTFEPMAEVAEQYQRIEQNRTKAIGHSQRAARAARAARKGTAKDAGGSSGIW
jgi:hypothetical protein